MTDTYHDELRAILSENASLDQAERVARIRSEMARVDSLGDLVQLSVSLNNFIVIRQQQQMGCVVPIRRVFKPRVIEGGQS